MKARNAGITRINLPPMSSYARVSDDQKAIDEYLEKYGARQLTVADNTGKVTHFNGKPKPSQKRT